MKKRPIDLESLLKTKSSGLSARFTLTLDEPAPEPDEEQEAEPENPPQEKPEEKQPE